MVAISEFASHLSATFNWLSKLQSNILLIEILKWSAVLSIKEKEINHVRKMFSLILVAVFSVQLAVPHPLTSNAGKHSSSCCEPFPIKLKSRFSFDFNHKCFTSICRLYHWCEKRFGRTATNSAGCENRWVSLPCAEQWWNWIFSGRGHQTVLFGWISCAFRRQKIDYGFMHRRQAVWSR